MIWGHLRSLPYNFSSLSNCWPLIFATGLHICQVLHILETRVEFSYATRFWINNSGSERNTELSNNSTNPSTLGLLQCGSHCTTNLLTYPHWFYPRSVNAWFTNWKRYQISSFKPSSSSGNPELNLLPNTIGILNCITPQCLQNSSPRIPALPQNSKMLPMIWRGYFSVITQFKFWKRILWTTKILKDMTFYSIYCISWAQ